MVIFRVFTAVAAGAFAATMASAQVARVTTGDDMLMPDGRTIRIDSGYVPEDALVIVRAVEKGRIARAALGQTRVGPGEFENLHVNLIRPLRPGETLVVMLHADFGKVGVYDDDPLVLTVDVPPPPVDRTVSGR